MGIMLLLISVPFYFFYKEIGIVLSILGVVLIFVKRQKVFFEKVKKEKASIRYKEIRFSEPISEETFSLSKIIDISPHINSHYNWLKDAIDALEKEFRISGKKTFLFNRNHSAAVFPYIKIRKESMDYKEGREFEKLFYKKGNYLKICSYLNRRTIASLEEELEKFIKLIEKQETK